MLLRYVQHSSTAVDSLLSAKQQPAKRPHLIRETPLSTVWHKKDDQFWIPKTQAIIQIVRFALYPIYLPKRVLNKRPALSLTAPHGNGS